MDIKTELLAFYSREGLNLIPLKYGDKKPAIRTWKEYQQRRITKEEINALFLQEKQHNIGVVCGAISDNLYVLDFDTEEIFHKFFTKTDGLTVVKTGRGYHVYFKAEKPVKTLKMLDSEEREIATLKGEGSYVVGPPSLHQLGSTYEFIQRGEISRITGDVRQQVKERAKEIGLIVPKDKIDIEGLLKGVLEGNRDNALLYLIHFLRRADISKENALKICEVWNKKNKPPIEDVRSKIEYHYTLSTPYHYFYTLDPGVWVITDKLNFKKKEKKEEFDFLQISENLLKETKNQKYHGTINFDTDIGIFFTVPFNLPLSLSKQPVFCNAEERFAQQIDEKHGVKQMKREFAKAQQIDGMSAHVYREFEGVPLYLSSSQRVQILKAFVAQRKGDKNACKIDREEINRLPSILETSYFKYNNNIEPYLVACWSIGTYLFPMFSVFPYLIFAGEKGTNKSGHLLFLSKICWNPVKLTNPTEAALFRMSHQAKPTQLIDEVHRLLNNPLYALLLSSLLETGHENGGFVPRVDKNDPNKIELLDVYCPKALATRESLEIEEKGISIILTKNYDKKYAIGRKNLERDTKLGDIQKTLFFYALSKWREIFEVYNNIEPSEKISGRYFLIWAPILAICNIAYPQKYDELLKYAGESIIGMEGKSHEVETHVLSYLATHVVDIESNRKSILLKPIREALNLKWQTIYSALRNLGLIKKSNDTAHGKQFYLHFDRLNALIKERNIEVEEVREKNVCDGCGQEAFTSEYESGVWLCDECRKLEEQRGGQKRL